MLSVVNERSSHGYDIWKLFIERYGGLFGSGRGEIYKALDRLERAGLLEELTPPKMGRSHAHYGVTRRGAGALVDWISGPVEEGRDIDSAHEAARVLSDEAHAHEHDAGARARAVADDVVVRMRATDDVATLMGLLDVYEAIVREQLEKEQPRYRDRAARWLARLAREGWASELQWIFWVRAQLRQAGAAAVQTGP